MDVFPAIDCHARHYVLFCTRLRMVPRGVCRLDIFSWESVAGMGSTIFLLVSPFNYDGLACFCRCSQARKNDLKPYSRKLPRS